MLTGFHCFRRYCWEVAPLCRSLPESMFVISDQPQPFAAADVDQALKDLEKYELSPGEWPRSPPATPSRRCRADRLPGPLR
jgi:hypothetical protein